MFLKYTCLVLGVVSLLLGGGLLVKMSFERFKREEKKLTIHEQNIEMLANYQRETAQIFYEVYLLRIGLLDTYNMVTANAKLALDKL